MAPSHASTFREGVAKRWQGHVQAGLLSRVITVPGCPRCTQGGRQHCWRRYRESLVDPARSENQGMYGTFKRENREIPWLPVRLIIGRAVQATLWR